MIGRLLRGLALGAAGLGLALTAAPAASVQAQRIELDQAQPINLPLGQTTTVTFLPDVRVNYLGKETVAGRVHYKFRLTNVGAAAASNVIAEGRAYHKSLDGSVANMVYSGGGTVAHLSQDQSVEFKVACLPPAGYKCDGASMKAIVSDDLDNSNNQAVGK